jgi:hypothetical protein
MIGKDTEVVMVYFKALSQILHGGIKKKRCGTAVRIANLWDSI